MKPPPKALIIFMRYPEPGRVKSRLAAAIGPDEAANVYENLTRRTLGVAADLKRESPDIEIFIFSSPPEKQLQIEESYPGPWHFFCQQGAHLGERMEEAIQQVMHRGYSDILLVGTDIADLEPSDLTEAFWTVEAGYAALGPAADGGFYLIGLNRPCPAMFQPESWGTTDIFERTEQLLLHSGWKVRRLKERKDVDCLEDLDFLKGKPFFGTTLSIIIPTLASVDRLESFLQNLQKQVWPGDEIIVVQATGMTNRHDAGVTANDESPLPSSCPRSPFSSSSAQSPLTSSFVNGSFKSSFPRRPLTPSFANGSFKSSFPRRRESRESTGIPAPPIISVFAPRGRGLQLNRGAAIAKGNLLFFLHDDSVPPPNFAYSVRKICERPEMSLGCFRLTFSPSNPLLDGVAGWANFRTRLFGLPYGDQGLFCRRDVYEKVGGYQKPFLMEDVDFVGNCRRLGQLFILADNISTSPERYLRKGILRASLRNHLTMLLYHLGVGDRRLYSFYYRSTLRTADKDHSASRYSFSDRKFYIPGFARRRKM